MPAPKTALLLIASVRIIFMFFDFLTNAACDRYRAGTVHRSPPPEPIHPHQQSLEMARARTHTRTVQSRVLSAPKRRCHP